MSRHFSLSQSNVYDSNERTATLFNNNNNRKMPNVFTVEFVKMQCFVLLHRCLHVNCQIIFSITIIKNQITTNSGFLRTAYRMFRVLHTATILSEN